MLFALLLTLSTRSRGSLQLVACGVGGTGKVSSMYSFRHVTSMVGRVRPRIMTLRRLSDVARHDKRGCMLNRVTKHARVRTCFTPTVSCSKKGCNVKLLAGRVPIDLGAVALPKQRRTHTLVVTRFSGCVCYYARLSLARRSHVTSLRLVGSFTTTRGGPFFLTNSLGTRPRSTFVGCLRRSFRVLSSMGRRAFPTPTPARAVSCVATLGRGVGNFAMASTRMMGRPMTSSRHPLMVILRRGWTRRGV